MRRIRVIEKEEEVARERVRGVRHVDAVFALLVGVSRMRGGAEVEDAAVGAIADAYGLHEAAAVEPRAQASPQRYSYRSRGGRRSARRKVA